MARVNLNFFF